MMRQQKTYALQKNRFGNGMNWLDMKKQQTLPVTEWRLWEGGRCGGRIFFESAHSEILPIFLKKETHKPDSYYNNGFLSR